MDRKLYQYEVVLSDARNQDEMRVGKKESADHAAGCKKRVAYTIFRSQHCE